MGQQNITVQPAAIVTGNASSDETLTVDEQQSELVLEDKANEFKPQFGEKLRTVVYVLGVVVGFACFLLIGSYHVLGLPEAVGVISGLVGTGFASVASAFGVVYNPMNGRK